MRKKTRAIENVVKFTKIVSIDAVKIGHFTSTVHDTYVNLGFAVFSGHRKKGYGILLVKHAANLLAKEYPNLPITSGTAIINIPTIALLKKAGFTKVHEEEKSFAHFMEKDAISYKFVLFQYNP